MSVVCKITALECSWLCFVGKPKMTIVICFLSFALPLISLPLSPSNSFIGRAFEKAAESTSSRTLHDHFDTSSKSNVIVIVYFFHKRADMTHYRWTLFSSKLVSYIYFSTLFGSHTGAFSSHCYSFNHYVIRCSKNISLAPASQNSSN